jgi:serine/threonine protein kinase
VTDKYEFGKKMGDGNFAIVRRSKYRGTDREVAIKIIDKSKMKGKDYMLDHEINIMYMCNHSNIIRLFEDYETSEEIYLIMELIKGGDLFDYISKHRRFDETTSALMIKDVSEALLYLHTKKIVHRDLKPENLLVMQRKDGKITIKLTDFGLAMQVIGPIKTVCGTPT